jgi:hypothetical protein
VQNAHSPFILKIYDIVFFRAEAERDKKKNTI